MVYISKSKARNIYFGEKSQENFFYENRAKIIFKQDIYGFLVKKTWS